MSLFPLPDDFYGEPIVEQKAAQINLFLANIIMEAFSEAGLSAGIVGGYARDTFFGVAPKDLDICVAVNSVTDDEVEALLDRVQQVLWSNTRFAGFDPDYTVCGMYNDHASDRACGVLQFKDYGIDVIFYRDCSNVQEIIDAFDFNINQFALNGFLQPIYLGSTDLRQLIAVRNDASVERCVKVMGKHSNLLPAITAAYSDGRLV